MKSYAWSVAYLAAVLETDNREMSSRITAAEFAIRDRLQGRDLDEEERHALQNAAQNLRTLRDERTEPTYSDFMLSLPPSEVC